MLRQIHYRLIFGCALLTVLLACEQQLPRDTVATTPPDAANATLLQPLDFAAWEATRQAMQPNIVVVDLWASWCVPCLERFPHMVALHRKYAARGVRFVSLSLDDRGSPADLAFAEEFLAKQNAPFAHYLLDEELLDGFDKVGIRGVPAVDIYGRDGHRAFRLTGDNPNAQYSDDDVEQALLSLLRE